MYFEDPIAVSLTHITKDKFGNPALFISIPNFPLQIGQLVEADIYKDVIIIAAVPPNPAN